MSRRSIVAVALVAARLSAAGGVPETQQGAPDVPEVPELHGDAYISREPLKRGSAALSGYTAVYPGGSSPNPETEYQGFDLGQGQSAELAGQPAHQESAADQQKYIQQFASNWIPKVENTSDPASWKQAFREKYGSQDTKVTQRTAEAPKEVGFVGPRSPAGCQTMQELRQWRRTELEKVHAFVPKVSRAAVSDGVERAFLRQAERIHQKEVAERAATAVPAASEPAAESGEPAPEARAEAHADPDAQADTAAPADAPDAAAEDAAADDAAAPDVADAGADVRAGASRSDSAARQAGDAPVTSLVAVKAAPAQGSRGLLSWLLAGIGLTAGVSLLASPACRRRRTVASLGQEDYIYLMEP